MNKPDLDLLIFKFIDASLDLHGCIQTKEIAAALNIHRTRAAKAVTKYKAKKPSNMRYNVSTKRYEKGFTFERLFLSDSSLAFLSAVEMIFVSADESIYDGM